MARPPSFPGLVSVFAVALVAAAIGDPLVESISNSGFFGRAFADASQQSVVPVLLAGVGLALLVAIAKLRERFGLCERRRKSVRDIADALCSTAAPRNVVAIFIAQLAIVFVMEWSESMLGNGQAIAGLSWLGAPAAFSLCVHFLVCVGCAIGVRVGARTLLAGVVAALCRAFDLLICVRARDASRRSSEHAGERVVCRYELFAVRRLRGRAPPVLAAFV